MQSLMVGEFELDQHHGKNLEDPFSLYLRCLAISDSSKGCN